jgi:hypothetical protein
MEAIMDNSTTTIRQRQQNQQLIDIFKRLDFFRQVNDLPVEDLEKMLKVRPGFLKRLKRGWLGEKEALPNFTPLYRGYGLNSAWLLSGREVMYLFKGSKTPAEIYLLANLSTTAPPNFKRMFSLKKLMDTQAILEEVLATQHELLLKVNALCKRACLDLEVKAS